MTHHCVVCNEEVPPDVNHFEIDAERVRMADQNDTEQYWMHIDCAHHTIGDWVSLEDQHA